MVDGVLGSVLHTTCDVIAALLLIYWVVLWFIHFCAIVYGCTHLHKRCSPTQSTSLEDGDTAVGVSILKPLVGKPMDPNLMTNLESYFVMDYPKYEIRFCVADETDPSTMVVKQLMTKYPNVTAALHVGGSHIGVNPKINNIYDAYKDASYPLLLISDAGIFMKPETLSEMVSLMKSEVGIVQQLPFITDKKGWPATLEKVFFGGSHARMYLFLHILDRLNLKVNCCSGMSCLIRVKMLQQAGGIKTFGKYLAEDYFMAKFCQENGWKMLLSSVPASQNHGMTSVQSYMARVTRWTKLRIKMNPATIIFDPLSECFLMGLLASFAATVHLQADFLAFFLFHSLAWILADWTLINILQNGPPPFSKFEFVVTWLFRECSAVFVFVSAIYDPVIHWRTGHFIVKWGGEAEKIVHTNSIKNKNLNNNSEGSCSSNSSSSGSPSSDTSVRSHSPSNLLQSSNVNKINSSSSLGSNHNNKSSSNNNCNSTIKNLKNSLSCTIKNAATNSIYLEGVTVV